MHITIEISLYPLIEDYTGIIIGFINNLKQIPDISVHSTAMSTYVSGEYDKVMLALTMELKEIYKIIPDSATVIKIIPKDLNVENGFLLF